MSDLALARLGDERWGERVRRARERAGLTVRQAAELVCAVTPTSYRSIARLEEEWDVPSERRQLTAYIAVLAYGYDPADFGLDATPASRLINRREVLRILTRVRKGLSIRWYYGTAGTQAA